MKQKEISTQQQGFGLAEVLLASGVLILVITSIISLSRFVVRGYALSASRAQATYLAQEGLEMARQMRDSLWIDARPDTDFTVFAALTGDLVPVWKETEHRFEFCHRANPPLCPQDSPIFGPAIPIGLLTFERWVNFSEVPEDSGIEPALRSHMRQVISTVTWTEAGQTWTVQAETYLTNWKPES